MDIKKLHWSVQWFIALLVLTVAALLASLVADRLDAPQVADHLVTGVVVLWLVIAVVGLIVAITYWNSNMIGLGATIAAGAKSARDRSDAQLTRSLSDVFRLGAASARHIQAPPPAMPLDGDTAWLPTLTTWQQIAAGDDVIEAEQ